MDTLTDMSVSLSEERDRIQRQVEELERSLCATHPYIQLLSSETDEESGSEDTADESTTGVLAQKEQIQRDIEKLKNQLGRNSSICLSDDDIISSDSSDESEVALSPSVESCLQMNLVYQQVVQETLSQLDILLTHNNRQQTEMVCQLSGQIKEPHREQPSPSSSYQLPINMYLGRFLKPYFKDRLTGLGPPANQETRDKNSRATAGCLDEGKVKIKRWESWQKTLMIHAVSTDNLRRLIQPKLFRVDYLSQKLSFAAETDKQQLREQIQSLERDINELRMKKEEELIGDRFAEHDWHKISNIDFEGLREVQDIRCFWQNFLHPSINKSGWGQEEVKRLKDISRNYGETHWESIAEELGTGRTAFMCLQTFQRFVSVSLRRKMWTPEEDTQLRELVDKMRIGNFIPYTQMSYFMDGREPAQLIYRWNQVLDPSLRKGPWTKEEDQLLLKAVSRHSEKNWWKVRLEVPGRTDSACRDRYKDCLKVGVKRGPFDPQEQELLMQLVEKHGVGRWARIAAEIPDRYDAQCLREWRKLSRRFLQESQEKNKRGVRKPSKSEGEEEEKLEVVKTRRRGRRKRRAELSSDEEEEEMMVFMDSDDEMLVKEVKVEGMEKVEEHEVERDEEFSLTSMSDWVPGEQVSSLSFYPVVSGSSFSGRQGCSGSPHAQHRFGRSTTDSPQPDKPQGAEPHNSCLLTVSSWELRSHLLSQAANQRSPTRRRLKHKQPSAVRDSPLSYRLQAELILWIGSLLIPTQTRPTVANSLRGQGHGSQISSTTVFQLLLQTQSVDVIGCRRTIEHRKKKEKTFPDFLTPPPSPLSIKSKRPRTVAEILEERRRQKGPDLQCQWGVGQMHTVSRRQQPQPQRPARLYQDHQNLYRLSGPQLVVQPQTPAPFQLHPWKPHRPPVPGVSAFSVLPSVHTSPTQDHTYSSTPTVSLANQRAAFSRLRPLCPRPPPASQQLHTKYVTFVSSMPFPSPDTPPPAQAPIQTALPASEKLMTTPFQSADHAIPNIIHHSSTPMEPSPAYFETDSTTDTPARRPSEGRKRKVEENQEIRIEDDCYPRGAGLPGGRACVTPEGKRMRRLSQKGRALQEDLKAKARQKKKRKQTTSRQTLKDKVDPPKPHELHSLKAQPMWIMTPGEPVRLVPATPLQPGLDMTPLLHIQRHALAPPSLIFTPASRTLTSPITLQAPPCHSFKPLPQTLVPEPVSRPGLLPPLPCPPHHPPGILLPLKGASVDKVLKFDPSLMFLEPHEAVRDWLSGQGGVVVPGVDVALPYLPPFISNLSILSALLRAKQSLTKSSLQLLNGHAHCHSPPNTTTPDHTSQTLPPQPDSTSDLGSAQQTVPPVSQEEGEELVAMVHALVKERFSSNPAYQLLKARFLSLFTVPALLATIQLIEGTEVRSASQEEEKEEEEEATEVTKLAERVLWRAQRSDLHCDSPGAPSNHFSEMLDAVMPTTDQFRPDQGNPNQTGASDSQILNQGRALTS